MAAALTNVRVVGVDARPLASDPPSPRRAVLSVLRILDETTLCACASVGADGTAHINTAYFACSDDLHLLVLSHPRSMHSRNLLSNASTAIAVYASTQTWTDPDRGVQLFGASAPAEDPVAADRIYGARFASYARWKAEVRAPDPGVEYRLYEFVARRVKILDEAEFGDGVWIEADVVRSGVER